MNLRGRSIVPLAVLLLAALAAGQVTQTGTLIGTVYDNEKQPLPGVTVSISSPALILPKMEMVTTERGFYRFPALPPGLYKITYSLPNFKTLIRENVRVTIGETTTIDGLLEMSALSESITVTGQSPTVDVQRTTLSASMTKEVLQALPVARTLGTFFNMTPGVTASTVHGSAERDNTYNLDGVNVTDPVTGTQAGSFSIDIMEELSVQTAGLPAEYGSVRGGVVNVVTKSGGNIWSGTGSFYFRNDKFQSDNTKGTVFEGQKSGFDFEYEPGINFGGPIIRDKIWFYGNFSLQKSQEYSPGYPYDKQPENTPLDFFRTYPYGKLTWQMTDKDKLVLSYNYSDYIRHHRGAGISQTEETTWNQTTPIHTLNSQFSHFFSSDLYMNVKAAAMFYQLNLTAKNNLPNIYDTTLLRNYQSYGYDDIYRRNRIQAVSDATYFVDNWFGRHEFKAGVEGEYSWDSRYRRHNLDPATGLGPFFYVRNGVPDYVIHYQDLTRKDAKFVFSGFVQDFWTPFERLTLNLGLRFDHQEGIIPRQGEDRATVTYGGKVYDPSVKEAFKPLIWNTLSPRFGLVFDLTNDDKTVLKASWSRYYIANIMQFFVWVNP
ncbi:MAG: TonB-dependent receptor, partial [Candidatus Aminicenantes bacterium]|nr:TonB-dependent receptor [Candidatus Aminicenantes bacterium]